MAELLAYWADEPPAHVILALRYLGPSKRGGKMQIDEERARKDFGDMARVMGKQPARLPEHLKALVRSAEQIKQQKKGI